MREIYFSLPLRILHHIKFISVHHGRTSICILPFKFSSVIGMDMAVEEKFRVVFIHQGKKCFKAPVRQILHIIQPKAGAWVTRISKPLCQRSFHLASVRGPAIWRSCVTGWPEARN